LSSYRASANSGSINCEPLRLRLCCLKIFPYLHAHRSSRHRKCAEGYPLVLFEMMGESPTNCRLKLSGGQQAKRHRAVCNRGHGIFSLCDEVQDQRTLFRASAP
jgi:hypothetical protein